MTRLFHATAVKNLPGIRNEGLKPGAYFGNKAVAAYYAETIADEGDDVAILAVDLTNLVACAPGPDQNGIDEPLTYLLQATESEVWTDWSASDGSWRACFDLIGSIRCADAVPASIIQNLEKPDPENEGLTL